MSNLDLKLELFAQKYKLSRREKDIVETIICVGSESEVIAESLKIKKNTVSVHLTKIFGKTGMDNKTDIVTLFLNFSNSLPPVISSQIRTLHVLVAEDSEEFRDRIRTAIRDVLGTDENLKIVADGQELMDYLRNAKLGNFQPNFPMPDLIILDLYMPRMSGFDALKEIRSDEILSVANIVVFSSTTSPNDIREAKRLGANTFVSKQTDIDGLKKLFTGILNYWGTIETKPVQLG
jgi:DNA-binding NarL/FixJ family response regulator